MKPLVIDTPSLQSLRQKYLSAALTLVFWVVWIYLWTPLVTLCGWLLGVDLLYTRMQELGDFQDVMDDFRQFLRYVAVIGIALLLWAAYNYLRFRHVDRRTPLAPLSVDQQAAFFQVDAALLPRQQQCQCLSLRFDADGHIVEVVMLNSRADRQHDDSAHQK